MAKKGQAAMEFLMTYGWAILVVLIAIGALAYFGVLNPSRFLPSSCTLMPGLSCESFKVSVADGVTLNVRNGMGVDLTGVTIASCGGTSASTALNDGDLATFTIVCAPARTLGSRFKEDLTLAYTEGTLSHSRTGQLVAETEA
ncbi:MAG: hypothetical protein V1906_02460 [Candidatus Woesearchaeota archaeon]